MPAEQVEMPAEQVEMPTDEMTQLPADRLEVPAEHSSCRPSRSTPAERPERDCRDTGRRPAHPASDRGPGRWVPLGPAERRGRRRLRAAAVVVDERDVHHHDPATEQVRGVYCKNRHFNDPRQLFCGICGINMVQQTPVLVNGIAAPAGGDRARRRLGLPARHRLPARPRSRARTSGSDRGRCAGCRS